MKYSEIKDIESLDAARSVLAEKLDERSRRLSASYSEFKDSVTPSGIFASALHSLSTNSGIAYDRIVLTLLRILKRKLSK